MKKVVMLAYMDQRIDLTPGDSQKLDVTLFNEVDRRFGRTSSFRLWRVDASVVDDQGDAYLVRVDRAKEVPLSVYEEDVARMTREYLRRQVEALCIPGENPHPLSGVLKQGTGTAFTAANKTMSTPEEYRVLKLADRILNGPPIEAWAAMVADYSSRVSVLPGVDGGYYKAGQDRLQVLMSERLKRLILSRMVESDSV